MSIIHVLKQAPSYWYLASPYSHPDSDVLLSRFAEAVRAAAWLANLRVIAFSPIAHSHPMAVSHSLPGDWEFWKHFDDVFVAQSSGVIVLTIDGWRESKGVKAEIELVRLQGLPVYRMQPEGDNYAFAEDIL